MGEYVLHVGGCLSAQLTSLSKSVGFLSTLGQLWTKVEEAIFGHLYCHLTKRVPRAGQEQKMRERGTFQCLYISKSSFRHRHHPKSFSFLLFSSLLSIILSSFLISQCLALSGSYLSSLIWAKRGRHIGRSILLLVEKLVLHMWIIYILTPSSKELWDTFGTSYLIFQCKA